MSLMDEIYTLSTFTLRISIYIVVFFAAITGYLLIGAWLALPVAILIEDIAISLAPESGRVRDVRSAALIKRSVAAFCSVVFYFVAFVALSTTGSVSPELVGKEEWVAWIVKAVPVGLGLTGIFSGAMLVGRKICGLHSRKDVKPLQKD